MTTKIDSARELLEAAYNQLSFIEGDLLSSNVTPGDLSPEQWIEKGDWLSLAKQVGAERVFFVENNPVIVFASSEAQEQDVLRKVFNNIWCMARPRLLFLAKQGELAVYDLTKPPAKTLKEWRKAKLPGVAKSIAEVATVLHRYRREQIESGKLFEDERFGKTNQRADQSLIRDLKAVRAELIRQGLKKEKLKYAHALIGRSIFIRYLEDREILTRDYFDKVAGDNSEWQTLLNTPPNKPDLDPEMEKLLYPRVLASKDFTYALFEQLAEDFNGDMFPSDAQEKEAVNPGHLLSLQSFLRGDTGSQKKLFFWAYKFEIIPIELISSIYEEFYHSSHTDSGNHGTHYTPSSLVEFVLSQVLTRECLEKNPRVLDPCCGSGIFLVESFRRIVRYRIQKNNGQRLISEELRQIMRDQIAGIEINDEAVRVAAFSLYLALLHYQEPRAIWRQIEQGLRLPSLKYQENIFNTENEQFNNLIEANAFDIDSKVKDDTLLSRFSSGCTDVVVGNPPWGEPKRNDKAGNAALKKALEWCKQHNNPVGDKEPSQAFIWRTLNLLREGGRAGLLVSTGVFFKHNPTSRAFRQKWLNSVNLTEVVNLAHVRDDFFSTISPFAAVFFQKDSTEYKDTRTRYWSAKKTLLASRLKAVVLNRTDLRLVRQNELINDDRLWKIYLWGSHRDYALISALELDVALEKLCEPSGVGQGFKEANKNKSCEWLCTYQEFPTDSFQRYGSIDLTCLIPVPETVERRGVREVYEGKRLLIKRGISQRIDPKGQIIARLESERFCFRNSIQGIKLADSQEVKYKILLAIFLSSLARYYFFLTASNWGIWHHEIYLEEVLNMPIRFPEDQLVQNRIISIVDQLRGWNPIHWSLEHPQGKTNEQIHEELAALEQSLDEAIFDLYELRESERDLVRDMCEVGIEFFYNHAKSKAVEPVDRMHPSQAQGIYRDIPSRREQHNGLEGYLHAFLKVWNRELEPEGEFRWRIIRPSENGSMLAIIFSTQEKGESLPEISKSEQQEWLEVLNQLKGNLLVPYNSDKIYIDGMVRAVTDTDIIIIKRNERRLWTRSMAREDAEATLLQAINLQEVMEGISQ